MILNFLFSSIKFGAPLIMGTSGEIVTEKSGSLNLGVEGMMAIGAIGGFYFGCVANSLIIALLAGFICAALAAMIYAFLTVTLGANQNVIGLTLTIFGVGVLKFIGQTLRSTEKFPVVPEHLAKVTQDYDLPLLSKIPVIGPVLFSHNVMVYIIIIIAIICWIYFKYTNIGLKVRAIGENPAAADACGINVKLHKYINICLGGGITGIGGVYLAFIINNGQWNQDWINGMGWISIALVVFANWSTAKAIFGSIVFGAFRALQYRADSLASSYKILGFLDNISMDFYSMLPFVLTALILIISSMRKKKVSNEPSACGINYHREER